MGERQPLGDWARHAACYGSRVHFPEDGPNKAERERQLKQAKAICRECPVQVECLRTAIANSERHGVWGGYLFPHGVAAHRRRIR